jgi:hypothetical protein
LGRRRDDTAAGSQTDRVRNRAHTGPRSELGRTRTLEVEIG